MSVDLTRRAVIAGASACVAAGPLAPSRGWAQASAHRFNVGAAEVTVFSDGTMGMPLDWVLPGRPRGEVAAAFAQAGRTLGDITIQVNVALVRLGADLILIDAGSGPDFAPQRGHLADRLAKAGIDAGAITKVVFTHAHPDHFWGVLDPLDDTPLFANARHFMTAVERDYWLKPGVETTVPEAARGATVGTQRRLKKLGDRIETFRTGTEIVPGLAAIDTSGHSPGHASLILQSGASKLMIGGDVLIELVLSFLRPAWPWGPDWDPDKGIAARQRTLDMLTTDKLQLLGYHLPWPGLGRVERSSGNYRLVQS